MSGITRLELTYGGAIAGRIFRRVTPALNEGSGADGCFLWATKDTYDEPIVEIAVLYDDEETPAGFERLDKDVTKGATPGEKTFLAFRRRAPDSDELAIGQIAVLVGEEPAGA